MTIEELEQRETNTLDNLSSTQEAPVNIADTSYSSGNANLDRGLPSGSVNTSPQSTVESKNDLDYMDVEY